MDYLPLAEIAMASMMFELSIEAIRRMKADFHASNQSMLTYLKHQSRCKNVYKSHASVLSKHGYNLQHAQSEPCLSASVDES